MVTGALEVVSNSLSTGISFNCFPNLSTKVQVTVSVEIIPCH